MKLKLLMLTAAMAMTLTGFAQNNGPRGAQTPEQQAERNKARIEAMNKAVSLTADEKTKIENFFKEGDAEMAKLRSEANGDFSTVREKMSAMRASQEKKIKELLGAERYDKYLKAMPQQGMGQRRR